MNEHKKQREQNPKRKRKWFGNRNRSAEETQEESLDRLRSSESAKQVIERFEKDTRSYRHGDHSDSKPARSFSFIITLIAAVLAVIIAVILLVLRKPL